MKIFSLMLVSLTMISCSSLYQEKVVYRMDDLKERPSWATMERVMYQEAGRVYIIGLSSAHESARIPALAKIADNNARFEISRFIENETGFIFQNIEEGFEQGAELSHFFGTEVSRTISHQVRTESRYYEKVLTQGVNNEKDLRIDMYSLISISESDLKKMVRKAVSKNGQISNEVKKMVTDHLNNKIETL